MGLTATETIKAYHRGEGEGERSIAPLNPPKPQHEWIKTELQQELHCTITT